MIKSDTSAKGVSGNTLLWRRTFLRADKWKSVLGATEYTVRKIRYGIRDLSIVPFKDGRMLQPIPQSVEDTKFALEKLSAGIREGIYEEVDEQYVRKKMSEGKMV